jgi:hypothetical protein
MWSHQFAPLQSARLRETWRRTGCAVRDIARPPRRN